MSGVLVTLPEVGVPNQGWRSNVYAITVHEVGMFSELFSATAKMPEPMLLKVAIIFCMFNA